MKFLKNTATDLFAHSARFVYQDGPGNFPDDKIPLKSDSKEKNWEMLFMEKKDQIKKTIGWAQDNLKKAMKEVYESNGGKGETPKVCEVPEEKQGKWGYDVQAQKGRALAEKINKGLAPREIHRVKKEDTLGMIVMGLMKKDKLTLKDTKMPVLYRSNRITPEGYKNWGSAVDEQGTPCFHISQYLGQEKDTIFELGTVNLIYEGQYVYIETAPDGTKYIVVDDKPPVVPGLDPDKDPDPDKKKQKDPGPERPRTPKPCAFTLEQEWNGVKDIDAFVKMADNAGVSIDQARADYNLLYGKKGTTEVVDRDGQKLEFPIERDGVYVVLENYLNPFFKDGVVGVLGELFDDKKQSDLAADFLDAGYKKEEVDKFMNALNGKAEDVAAININLEQLEDEDVGATRDFFERLLVGSLVGTATAIAFGAPISVPLLLAGAPLTKFRNGVKGFSKVPSANEVYEIFKSDSAEFKKRFQEIGVEGHLKTPETYIEGHTYALMTAATTSWMANDLLGSNEVLIAGPNPEEPIIELSEKQKAEYEKYDENADVIEGKMKALFIELMKMDFDITKGVKREAGETGNSDLYELKDGKWYFLGLDDLFTETEEDKYEEALENAIKALSPEQRERAYLELMNILINRFNENSEGLMECEWKDKLALGTKGKENIETLNAAFKNGETFHLGKIGENPKTGWARTLDIKFTSATSFEEGIKTAEQQLEEVKLMKDKEEMLSQLHVILDRLNGLTVSDIKGREKILRMIMTIIESIIDSSSEPTDMVDMLEKVKGELKSFKEKEQEAQHVITDHQGVKGTWEVFMKEQTDRLGQSTVETVKATFDPQEALAILSRGNANEIEEKLGISTEEERELVKEKLEKSLPMIGQLTQMSFLKDLMNLSHKYAAEKGKAEEIIEELAPRLTSETPEQRKYRLAVVSILTKFESWEVFNKLFSKAFDARVLTAIHTFYEAKDTTARSTAVYALINTENFPKEMAHLAQHMAEINQFMHIDDLAECVQKQRELINLSGDTAVKSSEFNTISFGDAYLVHLMYKSAMNVNVIKYFEYDTGFHNEAGESITYDIALPPETIRQWADKGWLDTATRKGLAALFGGAVSNYIQDVLDNDPTKPQQKEKKPEEDKK